MQAGARGSIKPSWQKREMGRGNERLPFAREVWWGVVTYYTVTNIFTGTRYAVRCIYPLIPNFRRERAARSARPRRSSTLDA